MLDARDETNPVPIATCPLPDHKAYAPRRPLRRAQHPRERAAADLLAVRPDRARHLLQRRPARLRHLQSRTSRKAIGDLRAAGAAGAPTGTIQINDVFVDEREVVYCVDRHIGGLYCLEMDF